MHGGSLDFSCMTAARDLWSVGVSGWKGGSVFWHLDKRAWTWRDSSTSVSLRSFCNNPEVEEDAGILIWGLCLPT